MLRGSSLLFALSLGCASTVMAPVHNGNGQAIYAMEACSQGPFQYSYQMGKKPQDEILHLAFLGADPAIKLFYRVEIAKSGRVLASGFLEKEAKKRPGGLPVKNPCVGRQMPSLAVGDGDGGGDGSGGGGVVVPGGRPPTFSLTYPQASLPEGTPDKKLSFQDLPPETVLTLVFWSEEPYPFEKSLINMAVLEMEEQPSPEALARKAEKQEKRQKAKAERLAKKVERALSEGKRRFEALKESDALLQTRVEALSPEDEEGRRLLEIEWGKLLKRGLKKLLTFLDERQSHTGYHPSINALVSEIYAFQQGRSAQLAAYESWLSEKRLEKEKRFAQKKQERRERKAARRAERAEKRRLARESETAKERARSARLVKAKLREFRRLQRKDARLAAKISSLRPWKVRRKLFLGGLRGEMIIEFQSDLQSAYYKASHGFPLVEQAWASLFKEVSVFYEERAKEREAYALWKARLSEEKEKRLLAKREKKEKRVAKRKLAKRARKDARRIAKSERLAKKAERVLAREAKRFARIQARDARLAERIAALDPGDYKGRAELEALRGRLLKKYFRYFSRLSSGSRYPSKISSLLRQKLSSLVYAFQGQRQAQLDAFSAWKRAKRAAREKERYARKEKRRKSKRERLAKRSERILAREQRKFEAVKDRDARLALVVAGLSPKDAEGKLLWEARRGEFLRKYYEFYNSLFSGGSLKSGDRVLLREKLDPLIIAFMAERQPQLSAYSMWEQRQEDLRYLREQELAKKKAEKKKERLARKGGAYREKKRWARFRAWEEALRARIASLGAGQEALREKLSRRRALRMKKRIAALLLAYDKTTPEGRAFLAVAYSEALLLQREDGTVLAGAASPPPPPAIEDPGPAPMVGAVWRPGYWKSEGSEWTWRAGFWELPPGAVPPPPRTSAGDVLVPQPSAQKPAQP